MTVTKSVLAVFSPTGGTEKVAQAVCRGMGLPQRTIDLSKETEACTLAADELLVAAFPVYGGLIPAAAHQRLEQLHGTGGPAVAVAVYGNRAYENALLEIKDVLQGNGFIVTAAGAFIAEHSIARDIAAGRSDETDIASAESFGAQVVEKIRQAEMVAEITVPGDPAYKEKVAGSGITPIASEACVACGICAALCPVKAIPQDQPNTTTELCFGCLRCVSVCPQHARDIPDAAKQQVGAFLQATASEPKQPELFL